MSVTEEIKPLRIEEDRASTISMLMSFCNFALAWQNAVLLLTLPWVVEQVGAGWSEIGWILGGAAIFLGVGTVVSSFASDLWGRGRLLVFSFLVLCFLLWSHVFVSDIWGLLMLRCMAGFASGLAIGIPGTIISDVVDSSRLKQKTGYNIIGYMVGQTLATPVALVAVHWIGYRFVFGTMGALFSALLVLLAIWRREIESHQDQQGGSSILMFWETFRNEIQDYKVGFISAVYVLSFAGSSLFSSYFPSWLKNDLQYTLSEFSLLYFVGGCLQIGVVFISQSNRLSFSPKTLVSVSLLGQGGLIIAAYTFAGVSILVSLLFSMSMAVLAIRVLPLQLFVLKCGSPCLKGVRMGAVNTVSQLGRSIGGILAGVLLSGALPAFFALVLAAVFLMISAGIVRRYINFEMQFERS